MGTRFFVFFFSCFSFVFVSVVYFSRGTLPKKSLLKGTTGPRKGTKSLMAQDRTPLVPTGQRNLTAYYFPGLLPDPPQVIQLFCGSEAVGKQWESICFQLAREEL